MAPTQWTRDSLVAGLCVDSKGFYIPIMATFTAFQIDARRGELSGTNHLQRDLSAFPSTAGVLESWSLVKIIFHPSKMVLKGAVL